VFAAWRASYPSRLPQNLGSPTAVRDAAAGLTFKRRRFLGGAATADAAPLLLSGSALAQTGKPASLSAIKPGTNPSFASIKQIDAGGHCRLCRGRSDQRSAGHPAARLAL
jgi:hypothetical protein